jgi:hypothetical protein
MTVGKSWKIVIEPENQHLSELNDSRHPVDAAPDQRERYPDRGMATKKRFMIWIGMCSVLFLDFSGISNIEERARCARGFILK